MKNIKHILLNLKEYFKNKGVPIILLLIIGLYLTSEYIGILKISKLNEAKNACNQQCIPNASEIITKKQILECWCYSDKETLTQQK